MAAGRRWRVRLPRDIERAQVREAALGEVAEVPSGEPEPVPWSVEWQIEQRGVAARSIRDAWRSGDPTRRRAARVLLVGFLVVVLLLVALGAIAAALG